MKIVVILALVCGFSVAGSSATAQGAAPELALSVGTGVTSHDPFYTRGTASAAVELTRPVSTSWRVGMQLWASSEGLVGDCIANCNRTFPTVVAAITTARFRVDRIIVGGGLGYAHAYSHGFSPENAVAVTGLVAYEVLVQPVAIDVLTQPLLLPNAFGGRVWILPVAIGARFRL